VNLDRAIDTIENIHGFADPTTGVGEAWQRVKSCLPQGEENGMNETTIGEAVIGGLTLPIRALWEEDVDGATVRRVEVVRRKAVQYLADGSTVMGRLEIVAEITHLLDCSDRDHLEAMVAHQ
jgi:hypothetical protein